MKTVRILPMSFNPLEYPLCLKEPRFLSDVLSWQEHIPFAFTIMQMLQPKLFVELGTHKGDSYLAFCQAVDTLNLPTACYAVDSWEGDGQAGFYDSKVYDELKAYHDKLYGRFSTLRKSYFDDALGYFSDKSIDLLHIDGLHTYEAVKHDFESWLPKVSEDGVILLHDTNVRERDFGVWRLLEELGLKYRCLEFKHCHGLGVISLGEVPNPPEDFFSKAGHDETTSFFHFVGSRISIGQIATRQSEQLNNQSQQLAALLEREKLHDQQMQQRDQRLADLTIALDKQKEMLAQQDQHVWKCNQKLAERDQLLEELERQLEVRKQQLEEREILLADNHQHLVKRNEELGETTLSLSTCKEDLARTVSLLEDCRLQLNCLTSHVEELHHSLSWKITGPFRYAGGLLKPLVDSCLPRQTERSENVAPPVPCDSIQFNMECISLEENPGSRVLFISGWCFSTDSEQPVLLNLSVGKAVLAQFSCKGERDDVTRAFPVGETNGSSLPKCGFEEYLSLKESDGFIELSSVSPRQVLYRKNLSEISSNNAAHWLTSGHEKDKKKELRVLIGITKKATEVVRWNNLFSISNWKFWCKCAIEEIRLSHLSSNAPTEPSTVLASSPIEAYIRKNEIKPHLKLLLEEAIEGFLYKPVISIVMPVYNVDPELLEEAISSVTQQIYPYWELCIADDASTRPETIAVLKKQNDPRIKVVSRTLNGHICKASNDAAALATGEFIALMDNDDLLSSHALFEIVRTLQTNTDTDLIYSDEDKIDQLGNHFDLHFKPDWSPVLLLGYNYINHLTCIRRTVFEEVGKFRVGYEGAQDYDLLLRITECTNRVSHIPKILYHWRAIPGSTAFQATEKPIVSSSAQKILSEALERRGISAKIYNPRFAISLNVPVQQLNFPDDGPEVEIIIPTFNNGNVLQKCIKSIQKRTNYKNFHITVINNASDDINTLSYLSTLEAQGIDVQNISNGPEGFSFSRINNLAVANCESDFVLFLNNDTEVIEPAWLSRLCGYLQLPGVGAAGARLLYPDETIQHAGVILGMVGGFIPDHAFARLPASSPGYFFLPGSSRECSAVTGACLLTRKSTFISLGGFDEVDFKVSLNDVDYCMRLRDAGLSVVYVAGAELYHHESLTRSREDDPAELANFRDKYGKNIDPYYNPNLSRNCSYSISTDCTLDYSGYLKKRLKAAFFTHNLNFEGAPNIMMAVMRGLTQLGNIDPIIVSPCDGPVRNLLEGNGYKIRIIKVRQEENILLGWSSPEEIEYAIKQVQDFLDEEKPDVVISNVLNTFFVIEAANRCHIPSLWWIHESYDRKLLVNNLQSVALSYAEKAFSDANEIIFVSKDTSNLYSSYNSLHNFNVIHNSLNYQLISNKITPGSKIEARKALEVGDKKVIVCVGTVCERKDQATLVGAALRLAQKRSDFILYIVGYRESLPYGHFVKRKIEENNLGSSVILIPETGEVEKYYIAADIFAFCSLNESYTLTILEAMAYGLPVVTTPCFGVSEQVRFGVNALRVEFKDCRGFAENLELLLDNEEMRGRFGKNSSEMMRYMQTEQEMLEKHENLLFQTYQAR